jgi:hypothetical protein
MDPRPLKLCHRNVSIHSVSPSPAIPNHSLHAKRPGPYETNLLLPLESHNCTKRIFINSLIYKEEVFQIFNAALP